MDVKILDCGRLKHDHVPKAIDSGGTAAFAANLKGGTRGTGKRSHLATAFSLLGKMSALDWESALKHNGPISAS